MTDHDIGDTLAPRSEQLDAVDLISGPRIFTITECRTTKGLEQPTTIRLAEFPRPWKPGKNQRRVLAFCWGGKGAAYVGRRVELYCDTSVVYGGTKVGGIRIRALSHIDGPIDAPIIPTRGQGAHGMSSRSPRSQSASPSNLPSRHRNKSPNAPAPMSCATSTGQHGRTRRGH